MSYCICALTGCSKPVGEATPTPDSSIAASSSEKKPHNGVKFYTVDHYDESRDPAADLANTIQRAGKENKRILIQVGGDWCIWCKRMSKFMETNADLSKMIDDNFLVMKVTYTQEHPNAEFLSKYPKIKGYPHLYVLGSDGKLLHSQDTDLLEKGDGYNPEVFLKFLADWKLKSEPN